jgi:hypothetical protein
VLSSYTHLQLLQPVFTLGRLALRDFTGLLSPSLSTASIILSNGIGAGHLRAGFRDFVIPRYGELQFESELGGYLDVQV